MPVNDHILVVEDQPEIRRILQLTLKAAGYSVLTAANGVEATEILAENHVDLILADIAMPLMNGYQLYEQVRQDPALATVPFIFLTARSLDSDIRYGKEMGVDDYLVKPIHNEDLLAVVQGKLRRAQQLKQLTPKTPPTESSPSGLLVLGGLEIDINRHLVLWNNEPIRLSAKEFTLLTFLAQHAGEVISPQELIRATHNLETDPSDASNLLRPLVRTLRRKLGNPVGEIGCIENVRGVGYRLIAPQEPNHLD